MEKHKLIEAYKMIVLFETNRQELSMTRYFQMITQMTGVLTTHCSHCTAATKQAHNSFTIFVFRKLQEYPDLVLPTPQFKGRLGNDYFKKQFSILSFELLRNNVNLLSKDIADSRKKKLDTTDLEYDLELLKQYIKDKLSFFDTYTEKQVQENVEENIKEESIIDENNEPATRRNRAVDKDILLQMKNEGKSNVECAEHFGVSKQAIGKLLKTLTHGKEEEDN